MRNFSLSLSFALKFENSNLAKCGTICEKRSNQNLQK